ncbi:MAG: amidoligase family protein [Desulfuromonadaceae bacterium]
MPEHIPFKMPGRSKNSAGDWRSVGFELEFTSLDLVTTIKVVEQVLSGREKSRTPASAIIEVENLGDFSVELDWNFLKQKAETTQGSDEKEWLEILSQAATLLVPIEVVCPPIPLNSMEVMNPLVQGLRQAGAVGTEDSLIAAYGIHINAEAPNLELDTIRAYVEAFALLQWWLVDEHKVDLARRVSPYVDLYPEAYLRELFSTQYTSIEQFIHAYLKHNASRNRALDMLPLLAHLNQDLVNAAVTDAKIKSRPAFHYRLPNCQIDKDSWSLAQSWNTWWVVEELANQPAELEHLKRRFTSMNRPIFGVSRSDWTSLIHTWAQSKNLI